VGGSSGVSKPDKLPADFVGGAGVLFYTLGMKWTFALALPFLFQTQLLLGVDLSAVAENNPEALRAALEAEGGTVAGEPVLARESGPDGTEIKLIVFPDPSSSVVLPVTPAATFWILKVAIRIDETPFGKSGGPMVGLLFGPNDSILAIAADKWSKVGAPILISGMTPLLSEEQFLSAAAMEPGEWRQVSMGIDGNEWHLKIGDRMDEKGSVENDSRSALARKGTFFIKLGNFSGAATLPVVSEP
jgi:hypothetical protein